MFVDTTHNGVCFVARVAAVLGLIESPNRFRQKERHSGEGYRVIGGIYPPAFHVTITRTDYLSATTFPVEALRQRGSLFLYRKDSLSLLSSIDFGARHGLRSASELYSARHEPGRIRRSRQDEAHSDSRLGRSYRPTYAPGINIRQNSSPPEVSSLTLRNGSLSLTFQPRKIPFTLYTDFRNSISNSGIGRAVMRPQRLVFPRRTGYGSHRCCSDFRKECNRIFNRSIACRDLGIAASCPQELND